MLRLLGVLLIAWSLVGCSLGKPQLADGDKIEKRTCRFCAGSGDDKGSEGPRSGGGVCPGCQGAKSVEVVLPGPNHPRTIKGVILDSTQYKDPADALLADASGPSVQPLKGALAEAKVTIEGGGTKLEVSSASNGRFRCALKPGSYDVTVKVAGFQDRKEKLEVEPLRHPIWLEKAHLKTPEQDDDTTRVVYLMNH